MMTVETEVKGFALMKASILIESEETQAPAQDYMRLKWVYGMI